MTEYPGERYHVYTDGSGNELGRPGGYGVVVVHINGIYTEVAEYAGFVPSTTSQRMELAAAIHGLRNIPTDQDVTVFSDSAYVVNGCNRRWYDGWKLNGWKNARGETPKNLDLWHALVDAHGRHAYISWVHVAGHQDDDSSPHARGNNRADKLAGEARIYGVRERLKMARHWKRQPLPLEESALSPERQSERPRAKNRRKAG